MLVETFQGIEKPLNLQARKTGEFDDLETYVTLADLKARITICLKVGLKSQTQTLLELYKAYYLKRLIPYPLLNKEEEETLSRIFPTRYKSQPTDYELDDGCRTLEGYNHDLIPLPALEVWGQCAEQHLFSEYEIWTAEETQTPDPILIGRRREHPFIYLIARWGDALHTWQQLAKETAAFGGISRYGFEEAEDPHSWGG